jgi:hypothetical protein
LAAQDHFGGVTDAGTHEQIKPGEFSQTDIRQQVVPGIALAKVCDWRTPKRTPNESETAWLGEAEYA